MKNKLPLTLVLIALASAPAQAATTILAGGCFWCMEADFEKLPGVSDVVSGFTGGTAPNPTYQGDHSGHYEAVKITYDETQLSYREILNHFWVNHDPFNAKGQFCDKGHSYLAAIFTSDPEEKAIAEQTKAEVAAQFPDQQVVTPILPASEFFPIRGEEEYHQDFYKKSPVRYTFYRWNCGRDQRLKAIWGDRATVD